MHDNEYELRPLYNHKQRCWFVGDNLLRQHQYHHRRRRCHHNHHHPTRAIHHVA